MGTHILEINLISAQGLKPPSANLLRMQTYALAWVDPSTKLRTRVDRVGAENPTWNDKFLFRVTPEFLSSEISGVCVEIYAVGCLRDPLIGTVRFLINNLLSGAVAAMTPLFTALQIRRPSGRFHGVLNMGVMVIEGSDFAALSKVSAIGYRYLMGGSLHRQQRRRNEMMMVKAKSTTDEDSVGESCENENCCESGDASDGADSTTSCSSTTSTALKDWNGIRDLAGKNHLRSSSDGGGLLCCLLMQRKYHFGPSDQDFKFLGDSQVKKI
ncbi:C2 domain-containing protein [Cephalotus follicularis]|uniref:C2 domain-containing protein n=1 Tax=Cephalotus follicularis TaxID=3775 RepID=A0A1Q3C9U7_CEPFO|nr:C2 domain-containing protein [Cephalotus follicularis]